eukprot:s551_g19.t1
MGRRNTSAGLREVDQVIDWIKSGDFVPDENRAGMFPHVGDDKDGCKSKIRMLLMGIVLIVLPKILQMKMSRTMRERAENAVFGTWDDSVDVDKLPLDAVYFRHPLSRTIHMIEDEAGSRFSCRRDVNKNHLSLPSRPQTMLPICKQCFSKFKKL